MKLYVGTSGYSYPEWKGSFYPVDLPAKGMLHYYGERFDTVEINNTFHRMPTLSLLEGWAGEVPPNFKFALKAPQKITHFQRLLDADDSISFLMDVTSMLGARLGPLLFQLPPGLKKDLPRLKDFLALMPPQRQVSFEFRHDSWFDEETFALLQRNNASLCITDREEGPVVPFVATARHGYLRLRRPDYNPKDLKRWVKQVREESWEEVFVFFKHEEAAKGPLMAKRFMELAG